MHIIGQAYDRPQDSNQFTSVGSALINSSENVGPCHPVHWTKATVGGRGGWVPHSTGASSAIPHAKSDVKDISMPIHFAESKSTLTCKEIR